MVFNEELLLSPISEIVPAEIFLTEMEQGGILKALRIRRVCTGQGHHHVCFGIAHLELWNEPTTSEHMDDVVSSSEINVPGFPEGILTATETADVFGCVKCLSDLGVYSLSLGLN